MRARLVRKGWGRGQFLKHRKTDADKEDVSRCVGQERGGSRPESECGLLKNSL